MQMLRTLRSFFYRLTGQTKWQIGHYEWVWQRYDAANDKWEYRDLTPEEEYEVYCWWAIK
ncbi:MAG: hypothetical protein AB7P16_28735 [Bradyrhizobium sp.]|uniref:hypothetical protein n=1 Tax=Bradyrhizobium sp. TaxID=376 RepID=UPI003D0B6FB2